MSIIHKACFISSSSLQESFQVLVIFSAVLIKKLSSLKLFKFNFPAWRNLFFSCLSCCLYTSTPPYVTVGQGCPSEIPRWRTSEMNWDWDVLATSCHRNQGHPPLYPHTDHTARLLGLLNQVVAEARLQCFICRILEGFRLIRKLWFHCCRLGSRDMLFPGFEPMTLLMKKLHHWLQYL